MLNKEGVAETQHQTVPSRETNSKPTVPAEHKDVMLEAKSGNADALNNVVSQKAKLTAITTSMPRSDFLDKIMEGMKNDATAKNLLKLAKEGKTRRFWESDGALLTIGNRLFVPRWGSLRKDILKECHDSL